jgi:hypothetical protein
MHSHPCVPGPNGHKGQNLTPSLAEVVATASAVALEEADPVSPEGKVRVDPRKARAREDAMVKSLLEGGPVAVIVLALAPGAAYLRVTTRRYREVSGCR